MFNYVRKGYSFFLEIRILCIVHESSCVLVSNDNILEQAGAELCQAQFKLGLAKPTVASLPPSQLC